MSSLNAFKLHNFYLFIKHHFIYFAPLVYICFLVVESYQMDFRAFYVAGRSTLLGLDPYLNPVGDYPELFAAGNADYRVTSGFIYPPFAALVFILLGWIPSYTVARCIFSLLMIFALIGIFYFVQLQSNIDSKGVSILFCLISIPVMALFERGQIDVLMVLMSLVALYLYNKNLSKHWLAALVLALATHIKIFPIFLLPYFYTAKRDVRFCINVLLITLGIAIGSYFYFGSDVVTHFLQRSLPEIFGEITGSSPLIIEPKQEVAHFYIVRAIQGDLKIFSHDFVNGPMNPIFFNSSVLSLIFGSILEVLLLYVSRSRSDEGRFYSSINILNLINPKPWIMGIVWYIPLFIYLFDRVNARNKVVLLAPLFLPAFLSLNGYVAIAIAFSYALGWLETQVYSEEK